MSEDNGHVKGKKAGSAVLNVSLALAFLLMLGLGGALIFMRQGNEPETSVQQPAVQWISVVRRDRLDENFAVSTSPYGTVAWRLFGQTDIMEVVWDGSAASMSRIVSGRALDTKKSLNWTGTAAGDKLTIIKSAGELSVYVGSRFLLCCSIPRQKWRWSEWLTETAPKGKFEQYYQKIGPLYFADNFMHGEGEMGEWKAVSGEWAVHALKTPVRSANPFSFIGKGNDASAATGLWFWRNYRMSCAVQPLPDGSFGMRIYNDSERGYELQWKNDKGGVLSLSRKGKVEGQEPVYSEIPLPLRSQFWYRFDFSCVNGQLRVLLDGNEVLRLVDPLPYPGGGIALLANGGGAIFDDVVVEQADSVDLKSPDENSSGNYCSVSRNEGKLVSRFMGLEMGDSVLKCTLDNLHSGVSLVMRSRVSSGENVFFRLMRDAKGQALAGIFSYEAGMEKKLVEEIVDLQEAPLQLSFSLVERDAIGSCNGKTLCLAKLSKSWRGGAAIEVSYPKDGALPRLSGLSWNASVPLPGIATRVATFSHERSMQNWNDPVREWVAASPAGEVDYWHRSDFWGDITIELDTRMFLADKAVRYGVAFGVPGEKSSSVESCASLVLDTAAKRLLLKTGDKEQTLGIANAYACRTLGLERRGDRLLARLNGELAWNLPLPDKLSNIAIAGRCGIGKTKEWAEAVSINAADVNIELFDLAPAFWVPVAGTWEVTNRWQCDPRWSFFSGVNLKGPACIWNKHLHGDNITLDFFVGPKMDTARGKAYEYAGDFNLVFAADGKDICSGYSIMLGGWDNRGTQIVRKDKILSENKEVKIPRKSSIHHRWFHIKARKRGGRITVWVDGALAVEVEDPEPLTGNRFGIWTWKNGIMVAQMRFATDTNKMAENSMGIENDPKTPYNMPK